MQQQPGNFWSLRVLLGAVSTVGTIVAVATATALIAPLLLHVCVLLWLWRPGSWCLQLVTVLLATVLFYQYSIHSCNSSPSFHLLCMFSTAGGKSSCTRNTLSLSPYNPRGLIDYVDPAAVYQTLSYCPFPELRWADANGIAPEQTSFDLLVDPACPRCTESCDVASRCPAAYPDPGRGLAHGYHLDASPYDTMLCVGVEAVTNSQGVIGRGSLICTVCGDAFVQAGLVDAADLEHCDPGPGSPWCNLCPGYMTMESWEPTKIRRLVEWFFFWILATVVGTLVHHCLHCLHNSHHE